MARAARTLALLLSCAAGFGFLARTASAATPPPSPSEDELKAIHQMLDQQSRQIDVLAQEIARLNLLLEGKTPTAQGLAASPAEAATIAPAAAPVRETPAESAPPAGPVHVVAKGETLTAIAKRYKVTVPDLLKVNKITDVRKLQIGQALVLPPGAKAQESPTPQP